MFFDGLSLYREAYGHSYTYDKNNNVISVTDAKKQNTEFKYNSSQDLTGLTDPKGNSFTYETDDNHNIIKSTSAENNIGVFTYDEKGNIIKSGAVSASDLTAGLWTERTFTSDRNHVASVTDTGGRTAAYTWNLTKDQLTRATDARGHRRITTLQKGDAF